MSAQGWAVWVGPHRIYLGSDPLDPKNVPLLTAAAEQVWGGADCKCRQTKRYSGCDKPHHRATVMLRQNLNEPTLWIEGDCSAAYTGWGLPAFEVPAAADPYPYP